LEEQSFIHTDRIRMHHKFLVCPNFVSDGLKDCQLIGSGFSRNYIGSDETVSGYDVYSVSQDEIIFNSVYKPCLYFLDRNTGDVLDSIRFDDFVKTQFLFPKKRLLGRIHEDESNQLLRERGYILRVYWDRFNRQYIVVVSHGKRPGEETKSEVSLFVFDHNKKMRFRRLIHNVSDTLNTGFMIPTPEGLLISSEFKNRPGRQEGTTRFRKFKFQ
jgi:hypothetical protein